ncbi:acyl-CoA dehydrogenase family protein [Amycolatopsis jiangsuensis]|uniref:Alkylation response protein AidB-like acyl-CoA dehydrogenase n=1 Tax=Amycolatopsis jiangsuensis TaxID=1181879 RepID=A0A840IQ14_9PSEU|nr:acyl-CoA dehydrogenase family protein [Amycolatopsis jiangsuensis]MBB4683124.1 alkylation response protein AidB-like acyl-CoA dehydrogenase [Amycolatopsis jiangsuensis]
MKFTLSPEQRQFRAGLDEMLRGTEVPAAARAWAAGRHEPGRKLLRALAELGACALLTDDRHGGFGGDAVDLVVAFEALGYHAVPGPVVESAAVAPVALTGEAADRWLPALATGDAFATVVAAPEVPLALDADVADVVLDLRAGSAGAVRVDRQVRSIDPARRLFRLSAGQSSPVDGGDRAFEMGVLAVCAQLLGAGQWLLDATVAYAKQRSQYGRLIGEYQAVKHLLADVATQLELARPLVHGAAVAAAERNPLLPREVSAAKVFAGEAAYLAARTALQVHGAIGYTEEHDLGLRLTKVRALIGAWGSASFHRARVLRAVAGAR